MTKDNDFFKSLYVTNLAKSYYNDLIERGLEHNISLLLSYDLAEGEITWEELPELIKIYESMLLKVKEYNTGKEGNQDNREENSFTKVDDETARKNEEK